MLPHLNLQKIPTSIIRDNATPHGFASAIIHAYTLFDSHQMMYGREVTVKAEDIKRPVNRSFKGDRPQAIARLSDTIDKRIKKYLRYRLRGGCGISKVTLDGTLEDWLHLQEKVAKIRDFGLGLDFWLDRFEPVIAQFVSTYKGDVDEKFWSMALFEVPYPHNSSGSEI
ncbi:hypothetical protein Glove_281g42 [Diversispora epigaea]|uniref:Uncharacterized protein n=1 Tax=Diversispora epigaea TaxID=1348612 RepID=A0A397I5W7_9GLOM|nr:hypothetical protein Glove_281g42 [Diversispora epigaea]